MRVNPTIRAFLKKEFIQALRDKRMRVIIFAIPVVQITVFGLALSNEIKNVQLALYAAPTDALAQDLHRRALASGWFRPARGTDADPVEAILAGRADAALVAPAETLDRALARGEGRLQLLVDATNATKARVVENYVQALLARTLRDRLGRGPAPPVAFDVRVLYNPTLTTSHYLVPGVMGLILTLVTILLTSMSMARERELGTFETLIAAPVARWEIFVGKTLPYVILGMADVPLVLAVGVLGFQVPFRGPLWAVGLASLVFVCTTVAVGTLISTFAKNQQQAMMGGFLFLFPAIQLSGVMAPLENIPAAVVPFSWLNPLRFFVALMRHLMLKGSIGSFYWINLGALALLALGAGAWSVQRFRRTAT